MSSKRSSITKALANKINELLDGSHGYNINLSGNAYPTLRFWDEVQDFPSVYLTAGSEYREYLPSDFTWGFLGISIKVYCKGELSSDELEDLLEDIERVIHDNRVLEYDSENKYTTTEILVQSITTDEGLLKPYAIGEMNIQVRYALV